MNNNDDYGISFMNIESLLMPTVDTKQKNKKKNNLSINKYKNNNDSIDSLLNFEDLSENKIKDEFADDYIQDSLTNKSKVISKNNNNDEYLKRYDDVIKYPVGSYHPIDFNYHAPEACGVSSKYLNRNSSMNEGLRKNGILCDLSDFEKYNINNPITDIEKENIMKSRKKACNCEHQRMLTIKHYDKTNKSDTSHLFAYNLAKQKCLQCYIFEVDLLKNGYLTTSKNKLNIYDIVWNVVDFIIQNENNKELYNDAEGSDDLEKIINYCYANLRNILDKKYSNKQLDNIEFDDFRKTSIILFYITKKDLVDKEIELEKESIKNKKKTKKSLQNNLAKLNKNEEEYRKHLKEMQLLKLKYMKNHVKNLKSKYKKLRSNKNKAQAQIQKIEKETTKTNKNNTNQTNKNNTNQINKNNTNQTNKNDTNNRKTRTKKITLSNKNKTQQNNNNSTKKQELYKKMYTNLL